MCNLLVSYGHLTTRIFIASCKNKYLLHFQGFEVLVVKLNQEIIIIVNKQTYTIYQEIFCLRFEVTFKFVVCMCVFLSISFAYILYRSTNVSPSQRPSTNLQFLRYCRCSKASMTTVLASRIKKSYLHSKETELTKGFFQVLRHLEVTRNQHKAYYVTFQPVQKIITFIFLFVN